MYLCHRLATFEHYRMILTTLNFEFFDKKSSKIFNKASTPEVSVAKKNV